MLFNTDSYLNLIELQQVDVDSPFAIGAVVLVNAMTAMMMC